jgi:hypothetical protein
MFFDLHPICRVKSRREIPNPNFQIPGKSQSPNSKKSKSDARTRAHSESPATAGQNIMAFRLHFARSALGVRCVPRIAFISQHHGWHVEELYS